MRIGVGRRDRIGSASLLDGFAESFCRSLRDDYRVEKIVPVKFALTHEQVQQLKLPPSIEAKPSDARYREFVEKYGTDAYELEAVDEAQLQ